MNELLAEFGFFIKFYERKNKFRYQLQQKLKSKNEIKTEFSACMIQKFNGYDLLRNTLQRSQKRDFVPIDIVYEPSLDVNKPYAKFLKRERAFLKNSLNLMLKNAIAPAHFLDMFKEIKVNVLLFYRQMLKLFESLKKH